MPEGKTRYAPDLTTEQREAVDETVRLFVHTLPKADACEHVWDGPGYMHADGCGWSATCSRCGLDAMSHDLRSGP